MPAAKIGNLRRTMAAFLEESGVARPLFEADALFCHVLGTSRALLHTHPERIVSEAALSDILTLALRRATGEPLAYLLGDALFCGRTFAVDRRTLIPRPETEILAARADAHIRRKPDAVFADWCTGSGCIAITLLADHPAARAFAVDASAGALAVAARNAATHGVSDRLTLIACADPRDAAAQIPRDSLDLVVCNPPYIATEELPGLEPQVRNFEPRMALDGGDDGLDLCRLLLARLPYFAKPDAPLLFETGGPEQIDRLAEWAKKTAPSVEYAETFSDQRGIRRFAVWRKSPEATKIDPDKK